MLGLVFIKTCCGEEASFVISFLNGKPSRYIALGENKAEIVFAEIYNDRQGGAGIYPMFMAVLKTTEIM